jgi:hypothetical protein
MPNAELLLLKYPERAQDQDEHDGAKDRNQETPDAASRSDAQHPGEPKAQQRADYAHQHVWALVFMTMLASQPTMPPIIKVMIQFIAALLQWLLEAVLETASKVSCPRRAARIRLSPAPEY